MNPLPPEEIEAIAEAVGLPAEKVREIEARLLESVAAKVNGPSAAETGLTPPPSHDGG